MDLPLVGGTFTRSNNRDHPAWSIIDRFFVSSEWKAQFPSVSQRRLPRLCSDQIFQSSLTAETLRGAGAGGGVRSFKF